MAVVEQVEKAAESAVAMTGGPSAPAPVSTPTPTPWAVRKFGALGSTPRRLRVLCTSILVLVAVTGALSVGAVAERQSSINAARDRTASLEVDAQAVDIALSDADATAAGSFLQGRIEPAALRTEYLSDTARASDVLAEAEQDAGASTDAAASFRTVAADLPVYTALVATASDAERQASYPLAAAYLAEANNLMRTEMLPAVTKVYAVESAGLAADESRASGSWSAVLAGIVLLVLLVVLVVAQVWMGRRFRRTLNVALAAATVLVVVVVVWFGVAVGDLGSHAGSASSSGSGPLGTFTRARIMALELRADDELTLLTRDSIPSYQKDATATAASLHRLLATGGGTSSRAGPDATGPGRVGRGPDRPRQDPHPGPGRRPAGGGGPGLGHGTP